jgi:hypothetical protein
VIRFRIGDGCPKAELTLSDEKRATLVRWARRAKSAQALALRILIALARADGLSNVEVVALLGVARPTGQVAFAVHRGALGWADRRGSARRSEEDH